MPEEHFEKIVDILRHPPFSVTESVTSGMELKKLKGWDSMKHLMLLLHLEEHFQIFITPEEAGKLITISDLARKITK